MDTNRIKKFAIEARNVLKAGVAAKLMTLGFKKDGSVSEDMMPTLLQGGCIWNGRTETEGFYNRWMSLYERVQRKGLNEVYEEVAYTWFNRFVAIRILRKNGLSEPVLDFVDAANTPRIVDQARSGQIPHMNEEDRLHLVELLDDDTKTTEQFALLMTAWCQNNPIISKCFGSIADYTEILLPNNILTEGGFIDMLNHTEFISDEDFTSPELIGWLYQFYISERKDEVFAKKGKFEADEIPAATQIFTPNWIVKYMVQNTVGRIYLDNNPYSTTLKANWKYLVEGEPTPQESIYRYDELTDLKVADLACGSGHILNECFDLLYELYIFEGYSRGEAIENIFKHNLTGIDLDKRAQQLSMFALLLKACQKDRSYADARCMPNVLTMPKAWDEEKLGTIERFLPHFFKGTETKKVVEEIAAVYKLMQNADSLGSIMKFDLSDSTRKALSDAVTYWQKESFVPKDIQAQMPATKLILALTEKYSALVMNPPYMGSGNMNPVLSKYVKDNYEDTKADLFSVFMDVAIERLISKGKYGMINMQSWIFLSSFQNLRKKILKDLTIDNMLHLGPRTFDELSGEVVQNVAFVISNIKTEFATSTYYRLVDGKNCAEKEVLYLNHQGCYDKILQKTFESIPGCPLGYWVNPKVWKMYATNKTMEIVAHPKVGMQTSNNDKYLRLWYEIQYNEFKGDSNNLKWIKYLKGGSFRRWYGNLEYLLWYNYTPTFILQQKNARVLDLSFLKLKKCTWSDITSNNNAFRYAPEDTFYDISGHCFFPAEKDQNWLLGCVNTPVFNLLKKVFNSTFHCQCGDVAKFILPELDQNTLFKTHNIVSANIAISKQDWDAHETSWDFQENELIALQKQSLGTITAGCSDKEVMKYSDLGLLYMEYEAKWREKFNQLHANEEELNRQFIEIYGLQDELTPDVPLDEVTILQQGEIKTENGQLEFQRDVVIKQLISYAVGCWMGRYRLDKPGLHIAHPSPTMDEICTYSYGNETLTIDDDGNIPLLPYDCPFDDNLQNRIADFVRIAFGADSLAENLNFIEQSLGCTIEKYLDKDFWKDHKKMYSNRPIYWLWSSKKGAFRVLSYMHRMDAYTAERIRSKYLLPYIEFLQNKINELSNRGAGLSTADSRKLDNYRKILEECQEYHERLQVVAEQAIGFDLDDGVVVNYAKFGDVLSKIK